ncbi:unnamed protein product [Musa hybrid cultivar]
MDIAYRINGTRQTLKERGIAAESIEAYMCVGEYFNSISRYVCVLKHFKIFKDDVTVLTQLSFGTNNETYNINIFDFYGPASAIGAYYVVV